MKIGKYKYLVMLILLVVLIWIISGILTLLNFNCWDQRGNFGNMFGCVGSLFSGLAMAGVIFTIILQKRALQEQSELSLLSARLSALSSLVNGFNEKSKIDYTARETRDNYLKLIEDCLSELEKRKEE